MYQYLEKVYDGTPRHAWGKVPRLPCLVELGPRRENHRVCRATEPPFNFVDNQQWAKVIQCADFSNSINPLDSATWYNGMEVLVSGLYIVRLEDLQLPHGVQSAVLGLASPKSFEKRGLLNNSH